MNFNPHIELTELEFDAVLKSMGIIPEELTPIARFDLYIELGFLVSKQLDSWFQENKQRILETAVKGTGNYQVKKP